MVSHELLIIIIKNNICCNHLPLIFPRYTIRTNPSHIGTPSTRILTTSPAKCRERTASKDWSSDWSRGGQLIPLSEMHGEDTCPVLQYYYSGFLALQTLIDYIKIKVSYGTLIYRVLIITNISFLFKYNAILNNARF